GKAGLRLTAPEGTLEGKLPLRNLPIDESNPSITKRLETRFTVMTATGEIYGLTYKWRADNSDADLLSSSLDEKYNDYDSYRDSYADLALSQQIRMPDVSQLMRSRKHLDCVPVTSTILLPIPAQA
ncbi:hypothetical protein D5R40_33450, partial [Okeania hirsuta]